MRRTRPTLFRKAIALSVSLQIILWPVAPALALPKGEQVTAGDVTITRQGDIMTVLQNSSRAIVNYSSFNIDAPETVQFVQPGSSAAILNRVTGDEASTIAGVLLANGNVYLINQNGILFTSSARISVASLFASALDMRDDDFLSGKLLFSGGSGSVVNQGAISASDRVYMFGRSVENSGQIEAPDVMLASASGSVEIDNAAGGVIRLIIDGTPRNSDGTPVEQPPASTTANPSPTVLPADSAQTPTDQPVGPTEPAAANTTGTTDGMVINEGMISASGDAGGSVAMYGTRVGQFGTVHADGSDGNGGIITIRADDTVALGETSLTTANAGVNGNGGVVSVISPDTALFRTGARIEAKGGSESGNGGEMEVSGRQHVEIFGVTDGSAPHGQSGTLVIDPSNVTIQNSSGTGEWIPGGGPPYTQFNPNVDDAVVDTTILLQSLQNNNVLITTVNPLGTQLGDITVASALDLDGTGGHTLTLQANHDVFVNANIADGIPGTADATPIILYAMNNVTINNSINTGGGDLSITADADFSGTGSVAVNNTVNTGGGNFISTGVNFNSALGGTINTGGGDVNLMGHTGVITINDTVDTTGGGGGQIRIAGSSVTVGPGSAATVLDSGDNIFLRANTGDVTVNGDITAVADITLRATAGTVITAAGTDVNAGTFVQITANDVNIQGTIHSPAVTLTDADGTGIGLGDTAILGGMNITGAELEQITATALKLETAGSIVVNNISDANSQHADTVTLDAGVSVTFASNDSTFNALAVQADNGIVVNRNVTADTGNLSMDGDADNAFDGSDNIQFAAGVTLDAANALTLDATAGGMTGAGALTLRAGNGITINDDLTVGGLLIINADTDASGGGNLTIPSGADINAAANSIQITANDLDLPGTLSGGSITITDSDGTGIGLGSTTVPGGLNISGIELQHITATSLALDTTGSVMVNNITAAESLNCGPVTIDAGGGITFTGSDSTFNALTARADDGIDVNVWLTTSAGNLALDGDANNAANTADDIHFGNVMLSSAGDITLDATTAGMTFANTLILLADGGIAINDSLTGPPAGGVLLFSADNDSNGSGTFSIASGATVNAFAGQTWVFADDIDLQGNLNCDWILVSDSDNAGIGIGDTTGGLTISGSELQRITADYLEFDTSGSVTVDNIQPAQSQNAGSVVIYAGNTITFANNASTFNALSAQADNGIVVNRNVTADTGNLALDGNANNAPDGTDSIQFAAGVTLDAANTLTLDATTGGMTGAGALTLRAGSGITINDDLTVGGLLIINADTDAAGGGNLTVPGGVDINAGGNAIQITANDLDLTGTMSGGITTITDSDGTGIGLGATAVTDGLNITGPELQRISAGSLALDTIGSITVNNILAADSLNCGAVTLDAHGAITFTGGDSAFRALTALADSGIIVNAGLTTLTGNLALDGDANNAADVADSIQFGNVTLTSAGNITLDATTGGMSAGNMLILTADGNIAINDNLSSPPAGGILRFSADNNSNGSGTFSIGAGATVNGFAGQTWIFADDVDLQGNLNCDWILISDSDDAGIGLGATAGGLTVSGAELQRITASHLELDTSGSIIVDNITGAQSQNADGVFLYAGSSIHFANNASTFNALSAQADNGIVVDRNVTADTGDLALDGDADNAADGNDSIQFGAGVTIDAANAITLDATTGGMTGAGALTLRAGNGIAINDDLTVGGLLIINADTDAAGGGNLTVPAGVDINAAANSIQITANDLDLSGTMTGGATTIIDSDGTGIGLGDTGILNGLNISGAELQNIFATTLELDTAGSIVVDDIQPAQSQNAATVVLDAGGNISFINNPSTFNALSALADDGISVDRNLTADTGDMSLDGDANNVSDGTDSIMFAAGVQLDSAGSLTLDATSGGMAGAGVLTLRAASGIAINADLPVGGLLTINADTDAAGGGNLTIPATVAVNASGNAVQITANDLDLQGTLSGSIVTITDSDGPGIGLGASTVFGGMNIDGAELQRITATELELHTAGFITVDDITALNSQNANAVVLAAHGSVAFINNSSVFNALSVLADDGITINRNISTDSGNMLLDGDANNAFNANDSIQFASGVQLSSSGNMLLESTTGDMAGAGPLTLTARNGIEIRDSLATAGLLTIDADSGNAGIGNLTIGAGADVNSAGNPIQINANDLDLLGTLAGGTVTITDSDGTGIGLGSTDITDGLDISGAELQRITATMLALNTIGSVIVDDISAPNSQNAGSVVLAAHGSVAFINSPSVFNDLSVLADNGITVNQDISADSGNMSLDGDADNAADGSDGILFADGVQLDASGSMTLESTTGAMTGAGALTLIAGSGINLQNSLTTAGDLLMDGDVTVAAGSSVRAGTDLTVSDGHFVRGLGSLGMYAGGNLVIGGNASGVGNLDLHADSEGDLDGQLWIKGNASTDGIVPSGIVTLIGDIRVDGSITVGAPSLSLSGADRNNVDYQVHAPIHAGGIIIRMGHNISDGTAGENALLTANNISLSARTGSIGGSGSGDIDIAANNLTAAAGRNAYIETAGSIRVTGGVVAGGVIDLVVHGTLLGDVVGAGNTLAIRADGDIIVNRLAAGSSMDLDSDSLEFDTLTASTVDADMRGGIAMGRATLTGIADFTAGGTISDHDSMITAADVFLRAGGNIGGSPIQLNVGRISRVSAGGFVHIVQNAPGNTPLGIVSAGDRFEFEVPNGGLSDGNGDGLNFQAVNDSYLALHGNCGGNCDPLEIEIDPGHLHVNGINISGADTPDGWIWISLAGELGKDHITGSPIDYIGSVQIPGLVLFNGRVVGGDEIVRNEIFRTEAFSVETPELKSKQGVFGSPYFLHSYMNVTEPIALGLVDYVLQGQADVTADPEFTSIAKRKITMWPKGYMW